MEDFSAYTLMLDVGWISLLMVIGNVLRHQVKFIFQDLLLPAPITAGLIGLLVGPNVLGWINFSDNLGDYTSILIAVVFASMAYSMEVGGNMGKGARNMWGYSTMMFTGQWGLFIVLGLFLFAPLFDTPNWFGMMLPVGFTGGFGTAAAVGGALEGVGADAASSLGLTSATVGSLAAIVPAAIASYWQALLLLFVLGTIFCAFFLLWFPAEFFGERWIERGIFGWGWATATVATGIAILKIVDPKLKSGTLSEYGMAYIGFGPFEISWTIIAPMAVMYGFTGAFGAISLAISIGVYIAFKSMHLLPPRGTIFQEGIGHVGQKQA